MGTQVLAGSKGHYVPANGYKTLRNTEFVVLEDTCMEADTIPVKFISDDNSIAAAGCRIPMKQAKLAADAKYKDY